MPKLEIGSGLRPTEGYIHMDARNLPGIDVVGDCRTLPFEDNHFDEIYGHWVLEHFYYRELPDVIREWYRCLKPGGFIHMITNNGEAHLRAYNDGVIDIHELNRMIFGVDLTNKRIHTHIEDLHKVFFTPELIRHFFTEELFLKVDLKAQYKHRDDDGTFKCPGLIIRAYKK